MNDPFNALREAGERFNQYLHESIDCPQCGLPASEFREGLCIDCCESNQSALDQHNAEVDRWNGMTDAERDSAIRSSC